MIIVNKKANLGQFVPLICKVNPTQAGPHLAGDPFHCPFAIPSYNKCLIYKTPTLAFGQNHSAMSNKLSDTFGSIDIYLFDQLLKGRFDNCENVIDIGCGGGRNIYYFLKNDYNVYGVDIDGNAIDIVRSLAKHLSPATPPDHFVVAKAEDIPFGDSMFDLVICSAVLHFANDKTHFEQMLQSAWRVLKPGGFFFARLASGIGIETLVKSIGNGKYLLPDASIRFLVNDAMLNQYTKELNGELFEPIKTTNVSNLRAMTTWCLRKN